MSKYIAWVTQNGKGCDYTIGCGQTLWELKAQTDQAAEAEAHKRIVESVHRERAERYKSITIYEVSHTHEVNVEAQYRKEEERLASLAVQDIERKERAAYERLKDKYGA